MDTTSLWHAVSDQEEITVSPALSEDIEVDVVIVGGGITGVTAALHLLDAGKKVALLEAYRIGDGTTGNSTGNLYIATAPNYQNIAKKFNLDIAKAVAYSRKKAIDAIQRTVQEYDIDCNFSRRPWYIYSRDKQKLEELDKEVATYKDMGIEVDYTRSLPLPFNFTKAAFISNQARFNPLKYVRGIAKQLREKGCLIYENTQVSDIQEHDHCIVTTPKGRVKANDVIIATHTPKGVNRIQMYTAPYRSYVVAVHLKDDILPEGHFWGLDEDEYISSTHAVSGQNPELLLVAGSHHKVGQNSDTQVHYDAIERYIKRLFPKNQVVHRWSAQHYQAADDIPYIGPSTKSSKHSFMATGFFADGLIYGTIAGKVLSDLITAKGDALADIYNPNRSTFMKSIGFVAKENINVFLQYLKDFPKKSKSNFDDIKAGEGKVLEINSEKCAVSRDKNRQLHVVSAVCTHMKCIVHWNQAEQTWDCPCHGSRFSQEGKVLEGPALTDLEKKNVR